MTANVLEAQNIVCRFGDVEALAGLSLEVTHGQIYGLVGPDGAGKTTALRILTGMMPPDSGAAFVLGSPPMDTASGVRELLGYMPQQYSLYGDLTVDENLAFFADMFCLDRAQYRQRSKRLLALTRLTRFGARRADALSGGMYKKLALACALLHRPQVLVLDEPSNGVDPVSRREFWALLGELAGDGMAVLISTPYMDEAARCHRVGLIHRGRLLEEGTPAALLERFPHPVFRVDGGNRDQVALALEQQPAVLALSPAGARMRAVISKDGVEAVGAVLLPLGAALVPSAPDFEDLFLTRIGEEA